jgi:chloramphenicol-sensitive protein RarD
MKNIWRRSMTNTSTNDPSGAVRDGLVFGVIAYTLWGLFPIYLKAVGDASALEILAHRILWSVPFGAVLIALRKQWGEVRTAFATPRVLGLLAISALAISFNWLIYVWAVINDHVLEASLGYYINPLMYVATGVFILGERLRLAQIIAVCLATIGVLVLTLGAGVFPWVSLVLAVLFTLYGFLRKTTPVGAMPGLFVETTLLSPIALVYLVWLMTSGGAVFLTKSTSMDTLLVLAGPVTVVPLVLFALSARRLRLSTIGFLQYIGPTLQLALGLYYGETFTWAHGVCFGLIWAALAIFSIDAARANRVERLMKAA